MLIAYPIRYTGAKVFYQFVWESTWYYSTYRDKYKNKWHVNTSELNIDGYHLFSNNLREQNREIIIITYVKQDLNCKQVFLNNSFMEYVLLEIQTDLNLNLNGICSIRNTNRS